MPRPLNEYEKATILHIRDRTSLEELLKEITLINSKGAVLDKICRLYGHAAVAQWVNNEIRS